MINGHPPLIVYEEDRSQYFDSLRSYDKDEDLEPLFQFFLASTEKTWANAIARKDGDRTPERKGLHSLL
jgi:hypothetical protein